MPAEIPKAAKTAVAEGRDGNGRLHQPFDDLCSNRRHEIAKDDAQPSAKGGGGGGFDHKLPQDVPSLAPRALRIPISRVRSVTDTA